MSIIQDDQVFLPIDNNTNTGTPSSPSASITAKPSRDQHAIKLRSALASGTRSAAVKNKSYMQL
jgi:hypothetical protein